MMLGILGFLVPEIVGRSPQEAGKIVMMVALILAFVAGSYISGVLLGFSLIENRDENTILSLAVTPASLSGYTVFKIVYGFAISVLSNLILLGGLKLIAGNQYVIGSGEGALRLWTIFPGEGFDFLPGKQPLRPRGGFLSRNPRQKQDRRIRISKGRGNCHFPSRSGAA